MTEAERELMMAMAAFIESEFAEQSKFYRPMSWFRYCLEQVRKEEEAAKTE